MFKIPDIVVLPGGRKVRALPPTATVEETIAYADEGEAQAELALEAEQKRSKPRKGVLEALESEGDRE